MKYNVTDSHGATTVTADEYRPAVNRLAATMGIDGPVLVHGTYAIGYHNFGCDGISRRCSGHEVARVRVTP